MQTTGNIVLVGVGGAGVSALALIFHRLGYSNLVGINDVANQITGQLQDLGIRIVLGHGNYKLQKADIVIYSNGGSAHSVEVVQARKQFEENPRESLPPLSYAQCIGEISKWYETICVCGTNGKSSTTALLTHTLSQSSDRFGLGIVGALVPGFGNSNIVMNESILDETRQIFDTIFGTQKPNESLRKKYQFVIESCEYKRHFLYYDPDYTIITNLELDHVDYYRDREDYLSAFETFASSTKNALFMLENDPQYDFFASRFPQKIQKVTLDAPDFPHFFGEHNRKNSSQVLALTHFLTHKDRKSLIDIMQTFTGVWRRMEFLGETQQGAIIYTDYAHYPTSIEVVTMALRERFPNKRLIACFQPHQAKRVLQFREPFAQALKPFDELWIFPIYADRESFDVLKKDFESLSFLEHIESFDQLSRVFAEKLGAHYCKDFSDFENQAKNVKSDSVIVVFSAGDLDYKTRTRLHTTL